MKSSKQCDVKKFPLMNNMKYLYNADLLNMRKETVIIFCALISIVSTVKISADDDDDDIDDDVEEEEEETQTEEPLEEVDLQEAADNLTVPQTPGEDWINGAVKDIAYYLRAHKFNDFDRRFHIEEKNATKNLFKEFPDPPLRSLHWEVRKYCEPSFMECIQYLHETVTEAGLNRTMDTVTVMRENNWHEPNNKTQIEKAERECQRYRRLDWIGAQPFQGPLERFQWRTSASYYMCWYTMLEENNLIGFGEACDNFANCLDPVFKNSNKDPRADDRLPYHCATYSFCPDPCCPKKHYKSLQECWQQEVNPCYTEAPVQHRECSFNRSKNTDFVSLVLNRWNTTCSCKKKGFEWDSKFGICIDVDECVRKTHSCLKHSEACFNIAGSYKCGCQWGYLYEQKHNECVRDEMLAIIEKGSTAAEVVTTEEAKPISIRRIISEYFSKYFHRYILRQNRASYTTQISKKMIIVLVLIFKCI